MAANRRGGFFQKPLQNTCKRTNGIIQQSYYLHITNTSHLLWEQGVASSNLATPTQRNGLIIDMIINPFLFSDCLWDCRDL